MLVYLLALSVHVFCTCSVLNTCVLPENMKLDKIEYGVVIKFLIKFLIEEEMEEEIEYSVAFSSVFEWTKLFRQRVA